MTICWTKRTDPTVWGLGASARQCRESRELDTDNKGDQTAIGCRSRIRSFYCGTRYGWCASRWSTRGPSCRCAIAEYSRQSLYLGVRRAPRPNRPKPCSARQKAHRGGSTSIGGSGKRGGTIWRAPLVGSFPSVVARSPLKAGCRQRHRYRRRSRHYGSHEPWRQRCRGAQHWFQYQPAG